MVFEEALYLVGAEPTWVLRDLLDRLPLRHRLRRAALVVLRLRNDT